MKCPKCNGIIPDGSKFCNHCGAKITVANTCPNCGAANLPADSRFCPDCGARLFFQKNISDGDIMEFNVGGVTFNMVRVEAGEFMMGAAADVKDPDDYEKPVHRVILTNDYYIGQTQVTQALWEVIMGNNPSENRGRNKPVDSISREECKDFCAKLSKLTGKNFRLPTEAEWEFAARGGNYSLGYQYSGSNRINDVAWYWMNSGGKTHDVARKKPNELGIYDMSGNIEELCEDYYAKYQNCTQTNPIILDWDSFIKLHVSRYQNCTQTNPIILDWDSFIKLHVSRGGSAEDSLNCCRLSSRSRYFKSGSSGFRLVFLDMPIKSKLAVDRNVSLVHSSANDSTIEFDVLGVSFKMVRVEAGTFVMGATAEMIDPSGAEKPIRRVTLTNDYYIGQTQVTQALWEVFMGSNPSEFRGRNRPVETVSWDDCQKFCHRLYELTGKKFRLPTEAEWEFAARGGNKSKHYQYSGSNNLDDVGWYRDNSGDQTHDVATKQPNELGIYDMSGNVEEWCSDWLGKYSSSPQTNPTGPNSGSSRVYRGGSWGSNAGGCRSSFRYGWTPGGRYYNLGLRLVLSE